MYANWNEVTDRLRGQERPSKVVLAAAHDEHALTALRRVAAEGFIKPVLVGDREAVLPLCHKLDLECDPADLHHETDSDKIAQLSVALINEGGGDFLMKGALETSTLLKAVVNKDSGLGCGRVMSHAALLEVPGRPKLLAVTDGGMIPYPTLEQKRDIIINAVELLTSLGYRRPLVAALAGTETVNPKMPETLDGAALKEMNREGLIGGCLVEGPMALDLALSHEKAALKGYHSLVAGEADILLAPNLTTGNCVSKTMVETAGAKMAGLIMGAKVPIVVTSRASSAREKYLSIILAAAGRPEHNHQ